MSVDLPAPFSPRSAWTSPRRTSRSMWSFARTPGNRFVMPRSSRIGRSGSAIPGDPKGAGRARPLRTDLLFLAGRRLDPAAGDQRLDPVRLAGVLGPLGPREPRAQLAEADTAVLDAEDLVAPAGEAARVRLERADRLVDGDVDLLRRARQDVPAEERLVGVDPDAPDPALLRGGETAEAALTGDHERDLRAALDLVERRLLALRLVGKGWVVRVVDEHRDASVRAPGARLVAGNELHDRGDAVRAHGRDHVPTGLVPDDEARDVADEIARLLLLEDEPAHVPRLRSEQRVRHVDARELGVGERPRDLVQRVEHQEPDPDHEAVALLRGASQVRNAVVRGARDKGAPLDVQPPDRPLEPHVREMVEALVVQAADVGDDGDSVGVLVRLRRRRIRRKRDDEQGRSGQHAEAKRQQPSYLH